MTHKEFTDMTDVERLFVHFYGKNPGVLPIKLKREYDYESETSGNTGTHNITKRQISAVLVVLVYSGQTFSEGTDFRPEFQGNDGVEYVLERGCTSDLIESNFTQNAEGEWPNITLTISRSGEAAISNFLNPDS